MKAVRFGVRYTADDSGYKADVSYIVDPARHPKEQPVEPYRISPSASPTVRRPHKIRTQLPPSIATPSSAIYVSTAKPPEYRDITVRVHPSHVPIHSPDYGNAYVISAKSTNIGRPYDCYGCDDDAEPHHNEIGYKTADPRVLGIYYQTEHSDGESQ